MKRSILIIFVICIQFAKAQSTDTQPGKPSDLIGHPVPKISEVSITGNQLDLQKLKGKVVVLNFWFIGCLPCMKEIPYLNSLNAKYDQDDFKLISIAPHVTEDLLNFNSDNNSKFSALRKHLADAKIAYEVIAECSERTLTKGNAIGPDCNRISSLFNVSAYPTTVVIDKKGIVVHAESGYVVNEKKSGVDTDNTSSLSRVLEGLLK